MLQKIFDTVTGKGVTPEKGEKFGTSYVNNLATRLQNAVNKIVSPQKQEDAVKGFVETTKALNAVVSNINKVTPSGQLLNSLMKAEEALGTLTDTAVKGISDKLHIDERVVGATAMAATVLTGRASTVARKAGVTVPTRQTMRLGKPNKIQRLQQDAIKRQAIRERGAIGDVYATQQAAYQAADRNETSIQQTDGGWREVPRDNSVQPGQFGADNRFDEFGKSVDKQTTRHPFNDPKRLDPPTLKETTAQYADRSDATRLRAEQLHRWKPGSEPPYGFHPDRPSPMEQATLDRELGGVDVAPLLEPRINNTERAFDLGLITMRGGGGGQRTSARQSSGVIREFASAEQRALRIQQENSYLQTQYPSRGRFAAAADDRSPLQMYGLPDVGSAPGFETNPGLSHFERTGRALEQQLTRAEELELAGLRPTGRLRYAPDYGKNFDTPGPGKQLGKRGEQNPSPPQRSATYRSQQKLEKPKSKPDEDVDVDVDVEVPKRAPKGMGVSRSTSGDPRSPEQRKGARDVLTPIMERAIKRGDKEKSNRLRDMIEDTERKVRTDRLREF